MNAYVNTYMHFIHLPSRFAYTTLYKKKIFLNYSNDIFLKLYTEKEMNIKDKLILK